VGGRERETREKSNFIKLVTTSVDGDGDVNVSSSSNVGVGGETCNLATLHLEWIPDTGSS